MYSLYKVSAREIISGMALLEPVSVYMDRLKLVNTVESFRDLNLVDINEIVRNVNEEIERNEKINQENHVLIHEYVLTKSQELMQYGITNEEIEEKLLGCCINGIEFLPEQLKLSYEEKIKEICLERDYELFLEQNKNKISREYFNKKEFYDSLKKSSDYKENYTLHITAWMYPLLLLHMQNNMKREEERLQYQRNELERLNASTYSSSSSSSSSFGSGFGGGHSSGGGFSGGG